MNRSSTSNIINIYLNGRFLSQNITGVQRYAHEILKAIDCQIEAGAIDLSTYSFCLLIPPNGKEGRINLRNIQIKRVGKFTGHLWEQLELPFHTRDGLLLSLCNIGPIIHHNQVVVIHDAAVFAAPKGYTKTFLTWYRFILPQLCRRSRLVVTVSEFSKSELERYCGAITSRIKVVSNGVDHMNRIESDSSTLDKYGIRERPFVLAVGSLHPNKNFDLFVNVAESLADKGVEFVVAGGGNSQVFAQTGLASNRVKFLGYVTDGELKALYEHASCFIFPSRYEGFGIPPLEAMHCGCPVVVSDSASLPEVCADAALYASPDSPNEFSRQVMRVLNSRQLQKELSELGKLQALRFCWGDSAQHLLGVVSHLF